MNLLQKWTDGCNDKAELLIVCSGANIHVHPGVHTGGEDQGYPPKLESGTTTVSAQGGGL